MKHETISIDQTPLGDSVADLQECREAGVALGRSHRDTRPYGPAKSTPPDRRRRVEDLIARAAAASQEENAAWVLDNFRLIFGTEKESREFAFGLRDYPVVIDASGAAAPRVCLLARTYLKASGDGFSEPELAAFLEGYQEAAELDMGEIWGLKPALQLELLDRLTEGRPRQWPVLLTSLRRIGETTWKDVFEAVSYAHRVLAHDPAGAYSRMDFDSRERYRMALADLAKNSALTEPQIAELAIDFCRQAGSVSDGSRAKARRTHVGFYLVDSGRTALESAIGYRPPWSARLPRLILRHPTEFYLAGIEVLTLFIVFAILYKLGSKTPAYFGVLLLVLPATQAASDFINNLAAFLVKPRVLPKLDFSEGIPDDCVTMVAVPALLFNEAQVHDLVLDLEIRFLANRDRNLCFALLTDPPDSDSPEDQHEGLVELCVSLIEGLNLRYRLNGRSPFFLFHRHHTYNQAEGRWMGWERKRGKLLDLNQLLRGSFDAFPEKAGDLSVLPDVRYVITLDSDTQLPRDSAAKLVGTIAHPLNQAVVDPVRRMVVEGYGILQPRIGISVQSASRSRLAALYSGQTGFDIYTRAASDVYQDLFGEGIFTGKAIYEVDALRDVLDRRFPENALLSHDLIEGAYARAALVSDIELIDDYPSHFSAYSRRKHRWMRGDWQIMRWTQSKVPDFYGSMIPNPINLISQWKILDNLRRSLLEAGLLLLLLSGWLWLPGRPAYWTAATILMWCVPVLSGLFFALLRVPHRRRALPAWAYDSARGFRESALAALCSLIFLLHQALISLDAIVRAVGRMFVTKKKMLEWETAAEAEAAVRAKSTVDIYLEWTPVIALGLAAVIWLIRPAALPAAAPLLGLWTVSRWFSSWLNQRPRAVHSRLSKEQVQLMRESADRIWRFFHDWSSASTNWLIPDSVRENGAVELRLSPTNLGMLLNARIAAVHLGAMPLAEFVFQTQQTLDRVVRLPKHRGHLLNWYDINTLEPLPPSFVSTVDSGNLAVSLWTLKQAALTLASESGVKRGLTKELAVELRTVAELCERLVREMDFKFLYQRRKKALSVGFDVATGQLDPSSYNLLASEARMASFVAIAKGDIPQESWFRLGRAHTLCRGERLLLSWSGTMFEYLMPSLWMRHHPDTIMDQSMKAAVRTQREYGRRKGVPWGISESAFLSGPNGEYGYEAFGVPELAMKRSDSQALVISPYSSFLAAGVDPATAVTNLRQMQEFGWFGRYGFYEAIDYSQAGGEAVRMWMAHHQGMSLLAIVNLLFDNPLRQYFHAEPQVLATELLLHERVPASALAEVDVVPVLQRDAIAAHPAPAAAIAG
jgi:cyclic beta-1,2-glucan synthetase